VHPLGCAAGTVESNISPSSEIDASKLMFMTLAGRTLDVAGGMPKQPQETGLLAINRPFVSTTTLLCRLTGLSNLLRQVDQTAARTSMSWYCGYSLR
jgi:hypothetical protein